MLSETPVSRESQNCWLEGSPEGHVIPPSGAITMLDQVKHAWAYLFSAWLLLRQSALSSY